jgi:hypothetical protein
LPHKKRIAKITILLLEEVNGETPTQEPPQTPEKHTNSARGCATLIQTRQNIQNPKVSEHLATFADASVDKLIKKNLPHTY